MTTKRLLIWGAAGHARAVSDVARLGGQYQVAAFLDDSRPVRDGERFEGAPVLGREAARALLAEGVDHGFVAIGDSRTRSKLAATLREWGFSLATVIHPGATLARSASIGPGTFVGAGVIVGAGARVGENVILNDTAGLGHDVVVHDGAHVGPRASVAGGAVLERGSWVAMGAIVLEQVRIGRGAVVGAAALALRDVPDRVLVFGVPGRPVRVLGEDEAAA